jgi:hypothetical protein
VDDGNKGQPAEPQIPASARHQRAMTTIMPDDEQHRDADAVADREQEVQRQGEWRDRIDQGCDVQDGIGGKDEQALRQRTRIGARGRSWRRDRVEISGAEKSTHLPATPPRLR